MPKSPEIYNYFYCEQTQIKDTLTQKTQQDLVLRQPLLCKKDKTALPALL